WRTTLARPGCPRPYWAPPWSCAYRLQRRSERSSAWPSKRQFPEKTSTRTPLNLASKPTAPICLVHAGSQCPRLPSNVQSALRGAHPGPNLRHKVQAFGVRTNSPDTLVAIANHHRLQDTRVSDTHQKITTRSPPPTLRCLTPGGCQTPFALAPAAPGRPGSSFK